MLKNVLVTGGAGFIGSHVVEDLLAAGFRVFVVDHLRGGDAAQVPEQAELYEVSLHEKALLSVFEQCRPEAVIHLAAQSKVSHSVQEPDQDAHENITGTARLLKLSLQCGVKRFLFASTAAVYGAVETLPITEETAPDPMSPYGLSKLTAEHYIKMLTASSPMSYAIMRLANVYGPRQKEGTEAGVIPIFIGNMLQGERPVINGDGEQTRDFIYVADVAAAFRRALTGEVSGIYHVSTAVELSVKKLLQLLQQGAETDLDPQFAPPRKGDIRYSCLSNTKLKQHFHWEPQTGFESGIQQTVNYYRSLSQTNRL